MDWTHALGPPQPLSDFLRCLGEMPRHWWLHIPQDVTHIDLSTPCRPYLINTRDISPEEADELDAYPNSIGLKGFLNPDQLEDIVDNLRQQRPHFSEIQLLAAINYYWNHDAFINLGPRA